MRLISTGERNVLESLLGTVEQQIGAQGVSTKLYFVVFYKTEMILYIFPICDYRT